MSARTAGTRTVTAGKVFVLMALSLGAWAAPPLPHSLQPALTEPGGGVTVESEQPAVAVSLTGPADIALDAQWAESDSGHEARFVVPVEAAPGRYDLVLGNERREGAVWVLESIPASYLLAFISGREPSDLVLVAQSAEEAGALALVYLGDDDDADAYRVVVGEIPLPVFAMGVEDSAGRSRAFAVSIGQDTLLFHDPRVAMMGAGSGELHRLRRATRASRWTIAVSPHFDPYAAVRDQLILFADDPVDMFVAPIERIPETPEELPVPGFWPRVRFEPIVRGSVDTLLVVEVSAVPLRSARVPRVPAETP